MMQVAKWGNSLAVRLPASVVQALDLSARFFLDTDTLVCILEGRQHASGVPFTVEEMEANRKGDITLGLLEKDGLFVGAQAFNELCNVALRRKFDWLKTGEMLATLEALCLEVVPLTLQVQKRGRALHENTGSSSTMP